MCIQGGMNEITRVALRTSASTAAAFKVTKDNQGELGPNLYLLSERETYIKDVEVLCCHVVGVARSNLLGLLEFITGNCDVSVAELAKVVDERRRH